MKQDLALAVTAAGAAAATYSRMRLTGKGGKIAWALIAINTGRALRHGTRAVRGKGDRVIRVRG